VLTDLSIRNYVLIDQADLKFRSGLNVITGETGAGKSIVIGALSMVLGERASSDLIRQGQDQATVEAVFELDAKRPGYRRFVEFLEQSGLEVDETLILKRTLNKAGKNRCYVNNSTTTLATLNEIGHLLVDLHGQHDHQTLLHPRNYLTILDDFGELNEDVVRLGAIYEQWRETRQRFDDLVAQERERHRILDQLRYQVNEIEQSNLKPGEEDELAAERRRLRNFEALTQNSTAILSLLEGGAEDSPGIDHGLGQVQALIEDLSQRDPDLAPARSLADSAAAAIDELLTLIRRYQEGLEFQPGRLDEIESRLHLIHNLKRKYGNSIEEILAFLGESKTEYDKLENFDEERALLEKELDQLNQKLGRLAADLTVKRRKVAKQLCGEITTELRQLGMPSARFEAEVARLDASSAPNVHRVRYPQDEENPITSTGWDMVHFRITTNPGEPMKTLRQVASGGEISRVMLAIKAVLARVDGVDALVFDEIDSGIGGKTALVVGGKIKSLSNERQVLCITHLAPIASKGDHHLKIEKEASGQTTRVTIVALEAQARLEELARMMGSETSEGSLRLAEEMLQAGARN